MKKIEITNKEIQQNIDLVAGETIKLDVAGVKTLEETPQVGYKAKVTIMYQEIKL